jgi:hypothetical protein
VRLPVVLLGPGPLGSSVLLKRPWVLLLRALLQVCHWCVSLCVKGCGGRRLDSQAQDRKGPGQHRQHTQIHIHTLSGY